LLYLFNVFLITLVRTSGTILGWNSAWGPYYAIPDVRQEASCNSSCDFSLLENFVYIIYTIKEWIYSSQSRLHNLHLFYSVMFRCCVVSFLWAWDELPNSLVMNSQAEVLHCVLETRLPWVTFLSLEFLFCGMSAAMGDTPWEYPDSEELRPPENSQRGAEVVKLPWVSLEGSPVPGSLRGL
jgi:hypothetical protein